MAPPAGHYLNRDAWNDWLSKKAGRTLTEVAALADINRATLAGIVGGFQRSSAPMAHKIARAMGCSVGTLFPTLGTTSDRFEAA
jgi:plasmid maintenance system antidote protein VapI